MAPAKLIPYGRVRYKTKEHPLYKTWRNIRHTYPYEDVWDDFKLFCATVGQRPHKSDLRRLDVESPFGPENWYWKPRVGI